MEEAGSVGSDGVSELGGVGAAKAKGENSWTKSKKITDSEKLFTASFPRMNELSNYSFKNAFLRNGLAPGPAHNAFKIGIVNE